MSRWPRCTDAELLHATARDADAFAEFYLRYERAILVWLRRRVGDPEVAADLLAEVFASALAAAGRFDPERAGGEAAYAWLFAIARNTLASSVARGHVAEDARRALAMLEPLVISDERIERIEELAAVAELDAEALLGELPEAQRRAVVARVLHERDYEEIAVELRCSNLVARKRVSRGLATLRSRLAAVDGPRQEEP
ncbi:MAG TPA: sigma-70 family RNA polymerase sigma factor [Solirubrobacteraceae bacterium]|nr:sigma-70 family RNA polymerase sigma factor [Solirubrobacteraceae bacterium]